MTARMPGDRLAVEVDDEAEDAVRRGVVRAEVDAEDVLEPVLLGVDLEDRRHGRRDARALVDARGRKDRHQSSSEKRTGSPPSGIVLAQRVPFPVLRHEDPDEVRVPLEADAHHVPGLALEPVGGGPDRDQARDRLAVVEPDLHAEPLGLVVDAEQVVRDREALRLRDRERARARATRARGCRGRRPSRCSPRPPALPSRGSRRRRCRRGS